MVSKKFKLISGLLLFITSTAIAQEGGGYSVFDSSVIAAKKMPQQNEFWNNSYNFPATPRNMWEVGASIGNMAIGGDVTARLPSFGGEVHIRKALGYLFSLRLQYVTGNAKGLNWKASSNYGKNLAWLAANGPVGGNLPANKGYTPLVNQIFYNYKTKLQDLTLQSIITLNNIRFHKQNSEIVLYVGVGLGFTWYDTKVNALDASGNPYIALFQSQVSTSGVYKNRKDILKALKDGMDKTYETKAENAGLTRSKLGDHTLRPSGSVLGGISYKLSRRINLALENRLIIVKDDLLDGQQWQEAPLADAVQTRDFDSWNFLSLGLNFNVGAKSVEPLWWLNPLDYAYSELNDPRHMKLPKSMFDDSDGDGVTDQLDREPNTPAACPVDAHGVTKDTDGDGIPDCRDKQLITPSECQPVDPDGVGKCPEPACCTEIKDSIAKIVFKPECPADYPSLSMRVNKLNKDIKAMLTRVAAKLKINPACSVTIIAYPGSSKAQQSSADKKLDAVKNYLTETLGISADRINMDKIIGGGDVNTIDIKSN